MKHNYAGKDNWIYIQSQTEYNVYILLNMHLFK